MSKKFNVSQHNKVEPATKAATLRIAPARKLTLLFLATLGIATAVLASQKLLAAMPSDVEPLHQSAKANHVNIEQQSTSVEIEIETGTNTYRTLSGYSFDLLGSIRFTQSAAQVGLHDHLMGIKTSSTTGQQLVNSLQDKGGAVVWEVARLKSEGDLVLPKHIFGYMDKDRYHSGLMRLNHNALQYIIIDVTPISHETTVGTSPADLRNIMAHEAVHAVLPNRGLFRQFEHGRALNELFTVLYTNQIRHQRGMPLRVSYGDPLTKVFDDAIREALKAKKIQPRDLVADLDLRLTNIRSNSLYEPEALSQYGISENLIQLFAEQGLLKKH